MGIGRLFLLTAGSGWPVSCGGAAAEGGTGMGRLFLPEALLLERSLRMPWATLSMSSTVVCMASAISFLVTDTKPGSLAREARPPFTRAWKRKQHAVPLLTYSTAILLLLLVIHQP